MKSGCHVGTNRGIFRIGSNSADEVIQVIALAHKPVPFADYLEFREVIEYVMTLNNWN